MAWDGGAHAFVLDSTVHPDERRHGLGVRLVRTGGRGGAGRGRAVVARGLRAAPRRVLRPVRFPSDGGGPARSVSGQPPKRGPVGQMGEEAIRDHSGSRCPGTVRPSSSHRVSSAR
ncbi:hypothetical protein [Streptomyces sp. AP-93]|uniref:hypothetical protein n=1 Tax=Streptomyces sp. AP-93 TaxID=2929048 RepID=UPI0035B36C91